MCIFTYLYLGSIPWYTDNDVRLMTRMVRVLGPLPEKWKGHYNADNTCDNSWYDQRRMPDPRATFEAIIKEHRPEVGPIERNHVLSIMSKGFCYFPEGRLTATQLLKDAS